MHEVAYVDIPLSQIMHQVEMIQLEQHIFFEQFKKSNDQEKLPIQKEFLYQKKELKTLTDKAVHLLKQNLEKDNIRFDLNSHQNLLKSIQYYEQQSVEFERQLSVMLAQPIVFDVENNRLESLAHDLEGAVNTILNHIDKVTLDAGRYTKKHEEEFFLINIILGVGGISLGLLLTWYLVNFFQRRIARIRKQIKVFDATFEIHSQYETKDVSQHSRDELIDLEYALKAMMQRLSHEIDNREQIEKQLLRLATQDKLTGAYNRHKWSEQLAVHLNLSKRGNDFSLILIDIDFFKAINDGYGHQMGDSILKVLVQTLKRRIRNTDMVFRLGGEEFMILMPMQNARGAYHLAERIRIAIEETSKPGLPSYTVSMGVTQCISSDDETSIYERVDKALYDAKHCGRNQVRLL